MLTAHELDQKFEVVPLGDAMSVILDTPKKDEVSNQSEVYLNMSTQKMKRHFYQEEEIVFQFNYEEMVILAARIKSKSISNLPEIIWKFVCASAEIDCYDPQLLTNLNRGRPPFYITPKRIFYEKRSQISYCTIRMCAMYLFTQFTTMTLTEIGQYFGGKHHTTVLNARKKIPIYLKQNHQVTAKVIVRTMNKLENYF